jgi:pyridoxal phosphate enzyme (YggS family)
LSCWKRPSSSIPLIDTEAAARLALVRGRIDEAARRAGREPAEIQLVAASKYANSEGIAELARAGQRWFGENRVQDAAVKIAALATGPALEWHLIGHLQSNKARAATDTFAMVESVDSLSIAAALARRARATGKILPLLLQVNVDADPAKRGFYTGQIEAAYGQVAALEGIRVEGLMTIGFQAPSAAAARPSFAALRQLRDRLDRQGVAPPLTHLSMGMSSDFEVAIEEGATIVRVGKALFSYESR